MSVFPEFEDGEEIVHLRANERHLRGTGEKLPRCLKVILLQCYRRQIDQGQGLVRLLFQSGMQVHGCVFQFSFAQFQAAQIDQHARRLAAACDRSLKKCALIFPIECADERARAQKGEPAQEQGGRKCSCPSSRTSLFHERGDLDCDR